MSTADVNNLENIERRVVFTLSAWAIVVFLAGYYDLFTKISLNSFALLVVIGIAVPVVVYYRNVNFRFYVSSINPKNLTILHLWRILAGFVFLHYGSQQLLPEQFVINAGYGDLAVGFMVPIVLMLKSNVRKYVVFHIFGLLDFVVAVGTGLTFNFLQVPLMENIATFPIVLIPLYGVCVTGAVSIMTLDVLLRRRKDC